MIKRLYETKQFRSEEGFSLIELAVTVLIIGILAAIAIPIYAEQQKTAIRAQVQTDLLSTAQSLAAWQQRQEVYQAVPSLTEFNNKIKITSNAATSIVFSASDPAQYGSVQVCLTATQNIGGTMYKVSYLDETKKVVEGACPEFVTQGTEKYN
jgi:prepilin-type N-terminal cleavage/methylation domain-containing protein